MKRKFHPFPDVDGFGQDDDMVTRKDLAKLLGVQEFTLRNWENAGLLPERAAAPEEGILINSPRVFWRVSELRVWVPRMVGVVFARPSRPKGTRRLEWIAGTGWVENAQAEPDEQVSKSTKATSKGTKPGRRTSKIPGRVLTVLTRLEGQIAALDRAEEPDEFEEPEEPVEVQPRRRVVTYRAEPEPQPFASNCRRPARFGGYWGV
jgi:hypothetical protein